MSGPNLQQLPNQPDQVASEGFNLIYFFRQWTTLARVINAIVAYLNNQPGPPTPYTPPVPTQTDVTSLRTFGGGPYPNSGTTVMGVSVTIASTGGLGGTATVTLSGGSVTTCGNDSVLDTGGPDAESMFTFFVLPGEDYQLTRDVNIIITHVIETTF